jgi:hypothetical protein
MVHKNHRTLEASVNAYRKTHQQTPKAKPKKPGSKPQKPKPNRYQPEGQYLKDAANVSLPIPDLTLKERPNLFEPSGFVVVGSGVLLGTPPPVNAISKAPRHTHQPRLCS